DRDQAGSWPEKGGAAAPSPGIRHAATNGSEGAPRLIGGNASREGAGGPPDTNGNGGIQLATYRDLWAAEVTDKSPALRFLAPAQRIELAPADAEALGVSHGDAITLSSNGSSLEARVAIRERGPEGVAFVIDGTAANNANVLAGAAVVEVRPAENGDAG